MEDSYRRSKLSIQKSVKSMFGAPILRYGDSTVFQYSDNLEIPNVGPNQVLIEVKSTSVNPIDLMKREGYGKSLFEKQRKELFPWVLGCDVSGIVKQVGSKVTKFKKKDEIWGCTSDADKGTYAEFVSLNQKEINLKPKNLTFLEAASLPYVALSTWSALIRWAALRPYDLKDKKVFINAGSGGIGTFAVQLLNYWGSRVATTCSSSNHELVKGLGAKIAIDYKKEKFHELLNNYDLVFDCLGDFGGLESVENCLAVLKKDSSAHYISLNHPFLRTLDNKGLILGVPMALKLRNAAKKNAKPVNLHWSIYRPSTSGLSELGRMVEANIIKPVIDSIYSLENIKRAHDKVGTFHSKGKVVIEVSK